MHRKDTAEEWAIAQLQAIIDLDRQDRDALPGSAVKLVKDAQRIMRKRRRTGKGRPAAGGET
ncbi:MAG: hypothetical protein GEV10_31730 [Streptosporangiales bacterium]|nr:hypothetical protein [Streptosporangiales bacterium]